MSRRLADYHQDILNLSLQEFARPEVINIAEHADAADLGRLLQLVLSKYPGFLRLIPLIQGVYLPVSSRLWIVVKLRK